MQNIRDWCISRQLWWGHRIPVWYCDDCGELTVEIDDPTHCSNCNSSSINQDEDVLDTWFSSWLWPFSTLGWPASEDDLDIYYPTSTLVTAHDIIFFWVARMIMAGIEFVGEVPFRDIYIHGMVRDDTGKKMSKSRGNTIDPLEIIEEFGADALRFSLIGIASEGHELHLSKDKFHIGRNLTNKIWNASRLLCMNLNDRFEVRDALPPAESLQLADRWILSRYQKTVDSVTVALSGFRFNEASSVLYDFFWHDYCDAYVELAKERWMEVDDEEKRDGDVARYIAWFVFEGLLRLFHPFVPFITEELWSKIPHEGETLMRASWPEVREELLDQGAEDRMEYLRGIIRHCLMLKGDYGVKSNQKAEGHFLEEDDGKREILQSYSTYITHLSNITPINVHAAFDPPLQVARAVQGTTQIFIPLREIIDVDKEAVRLEKEIVRIQGQLDNLENRLSNKEFLGKAPEDVVKRERSKQKDFREMLDKLEGNLRALRGGE
jgi:valyl-tRNA synthetase